MQRADGRRAVRCDPDERRQGQAQEDPSIRRGEAHRRQGRQCARETKDNRAGWSGSDPRPLHVGFPHQPLGSERSLIDSHVHPRFMKASSQVRHWNPSFHTRSDSVEVKRQLSLRS